MAARDETAAIVAIHGEVDREVNREPLARARVAQLLPPYQDDPNLSWYEEFLRWLGEPPEAEGEQPAYLDIGQSLRQLADLERPRPRPRMRARRMFAIAIAARAFPRMKNEDDEHRVLANGALRAIRGPDGPESQTDVLYKALAGENPPLNTDPVPGSPNWWEQMVETALTTQVVEDTVGMYPKPCSGCMVKTPGRAGPVDALRTEFLNSEVTFEKATNFLEPENWKECRPDFWCKMEPGAQLDGGQRVYHEVVSDHCDDNGRRGFWADTELLFNFLWVPEKEGAKAAIANYQLASGLPRKNDRILVDEGTLVVAKTRMPETLKITTTKRVRFSYGFPPGALALMMCPLGYAEVATDLMACAAAGEKSIPFSGVPANALFPGASGSRAARAGGGPGPAPAGGFFEEIGDIWAEAIRDGARAFGRLGGAGPARGREPPKRVRS